jgi:hypothetical protein
VKKDLPVLYGTNSLSDLNSLKGDLQSILRAILGQPILSGILITTSLSSTPLEIPHKLGRVYTGYIIVKQESWDPVGQVFLPDTPFTGSIYEAKSEDPKQFISLYSTGDVAVNMWVF